MNIPEQLPQVGHAVFSSHAHSSGVMVPAVTWPTASNRLLRSVCSPLRPRPASMGPPDTSTVGMLRRHAAISMPGTILSQLGMRTIASNWWPWTTHSTESAMTSRLVSEKCMPSWFMAMPSHTPMVLTCIGVPPAMRTPALTASATCWRWMWPGMTSFWAETTATSGRSISSSVRPSALSRLRCGARASPRLMASLRSCMLSRFLLGTLGFRRARRAPEVCEVRGARSRAPCDAL